MKQKFKKIFSLMLVVVMSFSLIPVIGSNTTHAQVDVQLPIINYEYANEEPGSAYGKITVTSTDFDTHEFFWGDGNGNKLTYDGIEFTSLGSCSTNNEEFSSSYQIPSPYTAIPEGAKELLVYSSDDVNEATVTSVDIPENKLFNEGQLKYKFGILSDVHYGRYSDKSEDDSIPAFNNALKFYNDLGITFVGIAGDISANGEDESYEKYNKSISKYPNMTVYTVMGNHDASYASLTNTFYVDKFDKMMNTKKYSDKNVTVIADNGVDFVYEMNGDIFIFFNQVTWKYSKTQRLITKAQMSWLEKMLNRYSDKNVNLFFHTYFASEDGDVTTAVGNLINPGGYTYDLTYYFGSEDEARFRTVLNRYPNVTVYSGHSHWAYDQQKYNPNLNIGNIKANGTGASLVHISSVTEPRIIGENDEHRTGMNGVRSEGTIAYKYDSSTVYIGIDFKSGKYLAYATYLNQDNTKVLPKVEEIKTGKSKITKVGKVKKLSKKSKRCKVYIKYRKVSKAVGYQIQYSTTKKFNPNYTKIRTSKKTSYTITKLRNKKTYYVRVRAYRYQFGARVYGSWTGRRRVKVNIKTKKKR